MRKPPEAEFLVLTDSSKVNYCQHRNTKHIGTFPTSFQSGGKLGSALTKLSAVSG